jgi:RIO kinase 1
MVGARSLTPVKTDIWTEYEDYEERATPQRRKTAKIMAATEADEGVRTGPLSGFFTDELIVGEPTVVKSGKEATVFCCQAHPRTGKSWLAAKVYRPRRQRNFKNDAVYQVGRTTLDARLDRAIRNKSNTGREAQFSMWLTHEFGTLSRLHAAGADVPQPFGCAESALLIEYFGERGMAAPQLINVELPRERARPLFEQLLHNLALFLDCDRVHGDLSPYNILYWEERLQIIDFPQAVDPLDNPHAFELLVRDVENVLAYFESYGILADPRRLALKLWLDSGRKRP